MPEWKVSLSFVEGNSSKFWRARTDGATLYVNYGRIGTGGQTQVKTLADEEAADRELDKLEREKRKKGYEDWSGAAPEEEEEEDEEEDEEEERDADEDTNEDEDEARPVKKPALRAVPAPPRPQNADFSLETEGRKIDLRLSLEGSNIRTVVVERYSDPKQAEEALKKLEEQMLADGYRRVAERSTL